MSTGNHSAAAAFWTPFASGLDSSEEKALSAVSLKFYRNLIGKIADDKACAKLTGVCMRTIEQHFPAGCVVIPEWKSAEIDFSRSSKSVRHRRYDLSEFPRIRESAGSDVLRIRREFRYRAPTIQVDRFLPWYRKRVLESGVELVESDLPFLGPESKDSILAKATKNLQAIIKQHEIDALVLCLGCGIVYSGFATMKFPSPDTFTPKKGVIAIIRKKPSVNDKVVLFEEGMFHKETLYMVPQVDYFVLGGTIDPAGLSFHADDWQVSSDEKEAILERATCFLGRRYNRIVQFAKEHPDQVEWRAGVRPILADHGPVVAYSEMVTDHFKVPSYIHYGHGGSGFTFFKDTAIKMVDEILPSTMNDAA